MQPNESRKRVFKTWFAVTLTAVLVAVYYLLYQVPFFSADLSDAIAIAMTDLAALAAALIATRIWRSYAPTSPPRRTWLMYGLALWGWAVAELIYSYEYFSNGSYQYGPADIFWSGSYVLFVVALYYQYGLIYRPNRNRAGAVFAFTNLLALGLVYFFALWLAHSNGHRLDGEVLVNSFYVIADFCLAGAALWLAFTFRDGALSRPWLGLLVFAFADLAYAILEIGGFYSRSFATANLLNTLTDTLYFAAYLALALGCYLHSLLLQYGLTTKK